MLPVNQDWSTLCDHVSQLSRRDFLKVSAIATSLFAMGLSSPSVADSGQVLPDGIKHMTVDEYHIWHRLMMALLPTEGSSLVDPGTLPVLQTVDAAFLSTLPPTVLKGLKGGIAFFNEAPKQGFGKRFVDLNEDEASTFCDALASSDEVPARALFTALKFLTVTAYWAIPPTWQPTGFQGPVSEKWGLEYAGNRPLPTA